MLEKVSQLAEQAATNVSRRQFLGLLGRGAMVVAAAAGGLLALPGAAHAKRPPRACDANSSSSCLGRNVGDVCFTGPYTGRCQPVQRKSTACTCDVGKPR